MSNVPKNVQCDAARSACALTVDALAQAKKLAPAFLLRLGLCNLPQDGGVGIPYYDRAGETIAVKRRTAIAAWDGSRWPGKTPLAAYGEWKIHEAAKAGWLILVEGESDCWTLWHHAFPALGLPGSSTARTLTTEHLVGITKLFIHVEADRGGRAFHEGLLRRLSELNFTEEVFTFRMPAGIKDPSELHLADPAKFAERLNLALHTAQPQAPIHLHVQLDRSRIRQNAGEADDDSTRIPADAAEDAAETRQACTIRLIDVAEEKVQWLWPGRIPLGKLTIIDGDPGLGKSTVTLDIAARVTRGQAMPATLEPCLPAANVVLLTAEDGLGDTVRPRLVAAGADLSRVIAFQGIRLSQGTLLPIYLPNNIHDLHEIVTAHEAKLVLIDPLMAYLPESVNAHNDQSVRHALVPLAQMAETTGAAVVVVRHLNKQASKNALYRGGGSIGIIGAARSGLLICKDDENHLRRYFGATKSNLCKKPKTLAFELIQREDSAIVLWQGEVDFAIEDALADDAAEATDSHSAADEFLLGRLADGPVPVALLFEEGKAQHLTQKVLRSARERHKIVSRLIPAPTGKGGHWVWELAPAA